jgi:hypothetical protein
MFAALDLMKPDFDFGEVNVVTNRNSLRKLLNFASGRVPMNFRTDVNMVHGTMFLTRRERSTTDKIQGSAMRVTAIISKGRLRRRRRGWRQ